MLLLLVAGCASGESLVGDAQTEGGRGCMSSTDCDDGNLCTTDECNRASGTCIHRNSCCLGNGDCDDGNACTEDVCQNGSCKHTARSGCCQTDGDCDDGNGCTQDSCNPQTGVCSHTMGEGCCTSDMQCDDGNLCTQDACVTGACQHNAVAGCCQSDPDCDDSDPCTNDSCATGMHTCSHSAVAGCCNADPQCDDGNTCTADSCNVSHQCVHNPVPGCCTTSAQCDDGNVCTTDTCLASTHTCTHGGVAGCCTSNGQCDDRNVCNGAEICGAGGTCQGGTALNCNDGNACTNDSCDPTNGCQHSTRNCNDGNACTTDSCNPSTGCVHTTISCDDGNLCTTDTCDATNGCVHTGIPGCAPRPNDHCAGAIDVTSMSSIVGSTLGAVQDVDPPAACSSGGNGGPDVFFKITIAQSEWVTLDTFGSAIDTVVYVLDGCGGNVLFGGDACDDDSGCNPPDNLASAVALHLDPGTYIIVVDSFGPNGAGAFDLHIAHSGHTCESAQPLTLGQAVSGSTVGGTNLLNPSSCGGTSASGPENMFFFFLCPVAGTFSFNANTCTGTAFDSVVYTRFGTCTAGDLACDDDGCGSAFGPSNMNAQNLSNGGGLYFVIVDGFSSADSGNFSLLVQ